MAWIVDESDGRATRLPAGPVDDDNRWPCCRHCLNVDGNAYQCLKGWHDEPCMDCHATPEPEEDS